LIDTTSCNELQRFTLLYSCQQRTSANFYIALHWWDAILFIVGSWSSTSM